MEHLIPIQAARWQVDAGALILGPPVPSYKKMTARTLKTLGPIVSCKPTRSGHYDFQRKDGKDLFRTRALLQFPSTFLERRSRLRGPCSGPLQQRAFGLLWSLQAMLILPLRATAEAGPRNVRRLILWSNERNTIEQAKKAFDDISSTKHKDWIPQMCFRSPKDYSSNAIIELMTADSSPWKTMRPMDLEVSLTSSKERLKDLAIRKLESRLGEGFEEERSLRIDTVMIMVSGAHCEFTAIGKILAQIKFPSEAYYKKTVPFVALLESHGHNSWKQTTTLDKSGDWTCYFVT